jgi:hypothetical protein
MNVFVGPGDESFDARSAYSTGSTSASNSIVAGDLNNDTILDIVVANNFVAYYSRLVTFIF